jgi:hypothetical protein
MAALGLVTGTCTGHICWPPMTYGPSLVTTVLVTKVQPLHDKAPRLPHCKPCGENPACHPGQVEAVCKTVMAGTDVPAIPVPTAKTLDAETDAILVALAPKMCATRLPLARISDPINCGSAVAIGSPTVLLCTGGGAATSMATAAAGAGLGAVAAIGAAAGIFTIAGMLAGLAGGSDGSGGGSGGGDASFDIDAAAPGVNVDPTITKTIGGKGGLQNNRASTDNSDIICD